MATATAATKAEAQARAKAAASAKAKALGAQADGTPPATGAGAGQAASGGILQVQSDGSLLLSGPADALASTAVALADPALSLFDGKTLRNVVGTPDWSPAPAKATLASLGATAISMSGVGRMETAVGINQPAFGKSLESLEIELVGTITPLPEGGTGRVDFIWNGLLIDSVNMSSDTALAAQLKIGSDQLNRENALSIAFSYVPPTGKCTPPPLAARLDIDTKRSIVKSKGGESVPPGFARFPQAFGPQVQIALGEAGSFASKVQQAGNLLEALQSLTPEQLTVALITQDDLESSGSPAILTGAGTDVTEDLGAPLTISNLVQVRDPAPRFTAAIPGPLALAQAFENTTRQGARDLMILGPIPADATKPNYAAALAITDEFAAKIAKSPNRWAAMTGQVMTLGTTGQLREIPLPKTTAPLSTLEVVIIITVVSTIALVAGLFLWSRTRPRGPVPSLPGTSTTK